MNAARLDDRIWLLWLVAASAVPLLSRNPVLVGEVLIIAWFVRLASERQGNRLSWLLRLAVGFGLVGVVFNALTVHAGDRMLFEIPDHWPVVGGEITLNAVVYGLCSALALVVLVLLSLTVGELVDWVGLFGHLPRSLSGVAVACSVAWMFLPQVGISFRQIREAQLLRGVEARSFRTMAPLILPLLSGALERALLTAEAMEARGYGASLGAQRGQRGLSRRAMLSLAGLLAILFAGFALGVGNGRLALVALVAGIALGVISFRLGSGVGVVTSKLHEARFSRADQVVGGILVVLLAVIAVWRVVRVESFRFEPYPDLVFPAIDPVLMGAIGFLLTPVVVLAFRPNSPR